MQDTEDSVIELQGYFMLVTVLHALARVMDEDNAVVAITSVVTIHCFLEVVEISMIRY